MKQPNLSHLRINRVAANKIRAALSKKEAGDHHSRFRHG